jgi:hypothetical protein
VEITLESNYYAFSAREEMLAVVRVTSGALDYSNQTGGPFRAAGSIGRGETREFTLPTVLLAHEKTTFDIDYPPPPGEGASPPLPEGNGEPEEP